MTTTNTLVLIVDVQSPISVRKLYQGWDNRVKGKVLGTTRKRTSYVLIIWGFYAL